MEVLQIFAIKASESVLLIRGGDEEEEKVEEATNPRCSDTASIVDDNLDASVAATTSKQKLHRKPGESKISTRKCRKADTRIKRNVE